METQKATCNRCFRHAVQFLTKIRPQNTDRLSKKHRHYTTSAQFSDKNNVDDDEITKLSKSASDWWDVFGEFHALHSMNKIRVPYIKSVVLQQLKSNSISQVLPLKHVNILDIGCGGGILSEALARLGANVTGIDASAKNIHVAMRHLSLDPVLSRRLSYKCITAQELAEDGHLFDCVVSSEVIEHITEKDSFVEAISSLLKPGGSVVMTTIGQTTKSYLAAIVAAEYLTRMVSPGTHDWNKFINSDDLKELLSEYNLETVDIQGLCFNPFMSDWSLIDDTSVNYAIHAVKSINEQEDKE
ncbi:uncharacterized protein LOC110251814 [Exaiptasia diaphana]|uniref:Ubiquinone biosynthesis O-methyltransferase, mitochondrial n=1 Tax=Exaiptasia diaphana TaxID=2652724 RepID=A0A913Y3Q5_EXADI|nr:uncharacterized protein LOC110251814 [Exaiptasia diaphana]